MMEPDLAELVPWAIRIACAFADAYRLRHMEDELVSDALYALHDALSRYDASKGDPRPFLRVRIVGELYDAIKNAKGREALEVALDDVSAALIDQDPVDVVAAAGVDQIVIGLTDPSANAEAQYLRHEAITLLRREVEKLDPDGRHLLALRYWEQRGWRGVAEALGIPERTAKDHDRKIREKLRGVFLDRRLT